MPSGFNVNRAGVAEQATPVSSDLATKFVVEGAGAVVQILMTRAIARRAWNRRARHLFGAPELSRRDAAALWAILSSIVIVASGSVRGAQSVAAERRRRIAEVSGRNPGGTSSRGGTSAAQ